MTATKYDMISNNKQGYNNNINYNNNNNNNTEKRRAFFEGLVNHFIDFLNGEQRSEINTNEL